MVDEEWSEWETAAPTFSEPLPRVRQQGRKWPCQICHVLAEGTANVVCAACKQDYEKFCRVQNEILREFPQMKRFTRGELFERLWRAFKSQPR